MVKRLPVQRYGPRGFVTAFPITLELSAVLLGSIPNFPTPWERRIAALVWGVQVTALTCLLLQVVSFNFFVALKLLNYSTGQLSPRGES